jgi:hypothetical protein
MYGWFSKAQAKVAGTVWYSTPDGGEIEVTQVTQKPRHASGWSDMICLGEVSKYLRRGLEGLYSHVRF